jgi:hypothetical protein
LFVTRHTRRGATGVPLDIAALSVRSELAEMRAKPPIRKWDRCE